MDWSGLLSTTGVWLETHPGIANWAQATGSLTALVAVLLLVFRQNREVKAREETDRIRRAQGLALLLDPVLTSFERKIESAISEKTKLAPPEEVMLVLDQLYILGIAGGYILQMVATLQTQQRYDLSDVTESNDAHSAHASLSSQRLAVARHYCEFAIRAMTKLAQTRTV
jgi:hypothetical protein